MKFIDEALQQLSKESKLICSRAATVPVNRDQTFRQLKATLEKLGQKQEIIKLHRPELDAKVVWAKFASAQYKLNALDDLQFRTLCTDEETAIRPEFVGALEEAPEKLNRSRCLYGVVTAYFTGWRTQDVAARIERLLLSVFENYRGKNPIVRRWLKERDLFSDRGAMILAEATCAAHNKVDDILNLYYVNRVSKLGLQARAAAARLGSRHFRSMERSHEDEWSLRFLRWLTEHVLTDLILPDAFSETISSLILSESAKRSENFQRALRSYIQNHRRLGDPRLRETAPNWRSMDGEASQRYLSWLARDSIIYFFNTILPYNNENRRRKDFWLRYHGQIKDFQVALSEADILKVKASKKDSDLLLYSQVDHPTASAFLMKFEGYVGCFIVVEFSEKGNAAYIFSATAFESRGNSLRTARFDLKRDLKFDKTNRILHHMGGWETDATYALSSEFGIRP